PVPRRIPGAGAGRRRGDRRAGHRRGLSGLLPPVVDRRPSLPPQIHKFGGPSLAHGPALARAVDIVRGPRAAPLVVVVSALAALGEAGAGAVQFVDAPEVVKSDGTFGHASPDLARTDRAARKVLGPLLARGAVPVVPGFLAATPDGQVATLGRGGSDLTATLL